MSANIYITDWKNVIDVNVYVDGWKSIVEGWIYTGSYWKQWWPDNFYIADYYTCACDGEPPEMELEVFGNLTLSKYYKVNNQNIVFYIKSTGGTGADGVFTLTGPYDTCSEACPPTTTTTTTSPETTTTTTAGPTTTTTTTTNITSTTTTTCTGTQYYTLYHEINGVNITTSQQAILNQYCGSPTSSAGLVYYTANSTPTVGDKPYEAITGSHACHTASTGYYLYAPDFLIKSANDRIVLIDASGAITNIYTISCPTTTTTTTLAPH